MGQLAEGNKSTTALNPTLNTQSEVTLKYFCQRQKEIINTLLIS